MNFYIIPTPIGNLNDLTVRAKKTIKNLDILIVESKQKSRILLEKINVKDKKLNKVYKGLTEAAVKEAFDWDDNFMQKENNQRTLGVVIMQHHL